MPSILVLGGGYAGLQVVRNLESRLDRNWQITLVDRWPYHQLITRLPYVVSGAIPAARAAIPYNLLLKPRVRFVQAEVQRISGNDRQVNTTVGVLPYDLLVVALGSEPDFLDVPGAADYGHPLRTLVHAQQLADALQTLLAGHQRVQVVVVGAGYTGTEIAGELIELTVPSLTTRKPVIDVTVVAQDAHLLPEGNQRLALIAERVLRAKGVHFHLGSAVQRVAKDHVCLHNSVVLAADLVIWAAHSVAPQQVRVPGWRGGRDGRVVVDSYLRVVHSDRVFVAGDSAIVHDPQRGILIQASAQLAIQQAETVARNVLASIFGKSPTTFVARPVGEALSLGPDDGVAEVAGVVVSGKLAATVKQAALIRYLLKIGGPSLSIRYQ